jgi:diaminopropionate ammonia-lyase
MRQLHELGVPSGPCGGASLAGVRVALGEADRRAALMIGDHSALVLISTEGAV